MGTVGRRMGTKMIFTSFSSSFFFAAATHAFPSGALNFNPSMVRQDGPLNMEALNMLHADVVKFGAGAKDNKWFAAVDAKTLDGMITEMNTMNRWFAKVVKYWDDFTSGGDGAKVLAEQGKGINEDEPVDGDAADGEEDPAADGEEKPAADGEEDPAADGEEAPAADGEEKPAADGEEKPAADGEEEPAADGDAAAADGDAAAADGEEEPDADGEAKEGADEEGAGGDEEAEEGGEKEEEARKRRKKMKRRMRKRL